MQSDYKKRLELAQRVARTAGELALAYFNKRDELSVTYKGLQDRVTMADQEVEKHIFQKISEVFPDDGFLGEEMANMTTGEPMNLVHEGTWVVDPIDGTDCFINGIPAWCISIAWIQRGEGKIGVIYDPIHDELFSGVIGYGAHLNGIPLKISQAKDLSEGITGLGYSTRVKPDDALIPMKRLLDAGGIYNRCGSGALSLAWVAAGRFIGYYEPHINSWDCLAGIVLVEEAGGWVNDFLSGDGLTKGNPIIASAPGLKAGIQMVSGYTLCSENQ